MQKILLIAWHEFKKSVFRRRFIGVLLLPLAIIAIATIVGLVTASSINRFAGGKIGYLDPSKSLAKAANPPDAKFTFVPFTDEASAKAALEKKDISGYLVLAPDFATIGNASLFYWEDEPDSDDLRDAFTRYRNSQLLADQSPQIAERVLRGTNFTFETLDRSRTSSDNGFPSFVVPLMLTVFFIIALFGGAQYLMQAVLDEKENRTMEVVVTSVTPTQLMAGKVLGLGAVGLLQVAVWLMAAAIAAAVLRPRLPFLQNISIKPDFIALALVLFVLQYLLLGSFMAAIGSMVVDAKQGQNYSSPFTLITTIPMMFMVVLLFDPNGVIAVILSLFPLTAPLALLVRYGMVSVPLWQVVAAIVLLAASAAGAIWLAGRIFRIGMLRFSTGVKWSEVAANIRF